MPKKSKVNKSLIKKQARFEKGVIFFLGIAAFFVGVKLLFPSFASSQSWHSVPRNGIPNVAIQDIGTGGAGEYAVAGGYVYQLNNSTWSQLGGNPHADRIAVGPKSIWVVQTNGDIAIWNSTTRTWNSRGANRVGPIFDVAMNSNDSMYFTRADGIYRSDGTLVHAASSYYQQPVGTGGLAVYPGYILWAGLANHFWYYNTTTHAVGQPTNQAFVQDVGAYSSTAQWFVSTSPMPNDSKNFRLYRLFSGNWTALTTGGYRISVDQHSNAWLLTGHNAIYHWY